MLRNQAYDDSYWQTQEFEILNRPMTIHTDKIQIIGPVGPDIIVEHPNFYDWRRRGWGVRSSAIYPLFSCIIFAWRDKWCWNCYCEILSDVPYQELYAVRCCNIHILIPSFWLVNIWTGKVCWFVQVNIKSKTANATLAGVHKWSWALHAMVSFVIYYLPSWSLHTLTGFWS